MASKNTILEWNYLWEQVVRNFGSDRITRQSPFVSPAQREQIYVAATGNDDSGTGRATHPFASIQKALEEVADLEGPVTINVGPGTFGGFRIDNLRGSATLKAGTYLIVRGSLETVAGPFTSTSATYSLSAALSTIVVAGSNWTVDQFKGCFLQNLTSASNSFAVIISNTIDTINYWSVSGFSTVGNSFQVVKPATIIQGPALDYSNINVSSASVPESGTEGPSPIKIDNSGNWGTNGSLVLQWMDISAGSGETGLRLTNSVLFLRQVRLVGTSTTSGILMNRSQFNATGCYFGGSYSGKINSSIALDNRKVVVSNSVFDSGNIGVFGTSLTIGGSYFMNHTLYGAGPQAGSSSFTNVAFESCAVGINVDEDANYTTGGYSTSIGINGGLINNGTTGVHLASNKATLLGKFFTITNCTTGILAQWGARVGVRTDFGITNCTTEVQLDAATTTLATMRAASPKIIRDTNFGSAIYESTFT
jgi:hypothetical protein